MKPSSTITALFVVFASFAPPSWAKSAPLEAPDPGRGIIGVTVKVIPPAKIGSNYAATVFFVRVVDDADRLAGDSLIPSNYVKGHGVYLLNAKPGRYVAIGCKVDGGPAGGSGFVGPAGEGAVVFSQADILHTEVEVAPGAAVFVGDIVTGSSTKTHEADAAQAHYLHMISPKGADQSFMARAFSAHYVYTGTFKSLERGEAAENEFWGEAVAEHFKNEPVWANRIAHRSASLLAVAPRTASTGASSSDADFVSNVCLDANIAKARASGLKDDAENVARTICTRVTTDWSSNGCSEHPDQDPCKKILVRMDSDLKGSGSSMLFAAAQTGRVSICRAMLAAGSDPSTAASSSWTPLMAAADQGHEEIVKLLLTAGAELNTRNAAGATALDLATTSGKQPVVDTLRAAASAAQPSSPESKDVTPR